MPELTFEQLEFLEHHGVPLSATFDADGMGPSDYGPLMSERGLWVAFNVTPCARQGHALRIRAGDCVQCRPSRLSYLRREDGWGFLYVAHSEASGLIKIGTTQQPTTRLKALQYQAHAGVKDWVLHTIKPSHRAGRAEHFLHSLLSDHRAVGRSYVKDGRLVPCKEVFLYDVVEAGHLVTAIARMFNEDNENAGG